MENVAFFDLEVSLPPKARIGSIGGWFRGNIRHTSSVHELEQFVAEAGFLCGHNIFDHDLPYLQKSGASESFFLKPFIDTLYLSTLLFSNRPYHKLVKDYQLISDHFNNPVEDSKLAADLLADCIAAFYNHPAALQKILLCLLKR